MNGGPDGCSSVPPVSALARERTVSGAASGRGDRVAGWWRRRV